MFHQTDDDGFWHLLKNDKFFKEKGNPSPISCKKYSDMQIIYRRFNSIELFYLEFFFNFFSLLIIYWSEKVLNICCLGLLEAQTSSGYQLDLFGISYV